MTDRREPISPALRYWHHIALTMVLLTVILVATTPPSAQAAVTVVQGGTYENTSSAVVYAGTWNVASSASDSGGSISTLAVAGSAQLSFNEKSIKWVARKASAFGIANVYLDGTLVKTVDLYAASNTYQFVAYTSPTLAYGTHTLRVERSGLKNDASSGRNIDLDSFVVPDTRAPATPQRLTATADGANAKLAWTANTETDLAGYRVYRAVGSATSYQVLTTTSPTATSYVDPALTPGTRYRYQISAVDRTGNESARTADTSLDSAATAVGWGTYDNSSAKVIYNGTWATASSASDSGGSIATLGDTGFTQLAFTETSVKWVARKASAYGIANVYLDGTLVKTVDLYAATNTYQFVAYTSPTLSFGTHTIRVERSGLKNDASAGRTIDLDSFVVPDSRAPSTPQSLTATPDGANAKLTWTANTENDLAGYRIYRAVEPSGSYQLLASPSATSTSYVDPALTPGTRYRYQLSAVDSTGNESARTADTTLDSAATAVGAGTQENSSAKVIYNGTWVTTSSSSDSGGSIATLSDAGFTQLAFTETSVKWIARKASSFGIANVYLDGTLVKTVDLYAPSNIYRATVYTSPTLSYGTHTIRVERSGQKNDASSGRNIDLDSFLVPDTRAPGVPAGLTVANEGAGDRLTWTANPESDVAGYRVYRSSGTSTTYEALTTAPLDATTFLDPDLTPSTNFRYQISALDLSGNESDRTADVLIRSAGSHGTFESDGESVSLVGPWVTSSDNAASDQSIETITSAGSASLTFNETGVRWIGSTSPTGGIAQVYLDGALVDTVDQYSATTVQSVTLYTTHGLPRGSHTITVTWTQDHNAAVTTNQPATVVDAFEVDDTIAPAVPQAVWAQPAGGGIHLEWGVATETDTSGYLVYRAKGTDGPFVLITEDNPVQDHMIFDDALEPGAGYRYQVSAVDAAGNESRGSMIVPATTAVSTGTLENTSDPVLYSTPWTITPSSRDSGGNSSTLTVPGTAQLTFSGTGIKWTTRTNNFSGIARVFVDDVAVKDVDLYSSTQVYQKVVYSKLNLAEGNHTIRISRLGTKNAASTGRGISLDNFVVLDSTPPHAMPAPTLTQDKSGIKLGWTESPAVDVATYSIYRRTGTAPEILLANVPLLQLNFLDVGLDDSTLYTYRITASDTSGNESTSAASAQLYSRDATPTVTQRYANCPTATRTVSTTGTLQNALTQAAPGDVIRLAPGRYSGYFTMAVTASADKPIWICGPRTAVLDFGRTSSGYGFYLNKSSYVNLSGMTIRNSQKGIIVAGGDHNVISDVAVDTIGEEAVHLRSSTTDNIVIGNVIRNTGLLTPGYGEGVYIGSDPTNWCNYSGCLPDQSDRNSILGNDISGTTAEGIEAKAGTVDGVVQGNTIDGSLMTVPNSSGWVVIKGSSWLVKGNTGANAPENGFQATLSKAAFWGQRNVFVENFATLNNTVGYGTWIQKGIGNIAGCSENTVDGLRKTNVACQR